MLIAAGFATYIQQPSGGLHFYEWALLLPRSTALQALC